MHFTIQGTKLLSVDPGDQVIIKLPSHITELSPDAFRNCKSVIEITLSDGIQSIPEKCFEGLSKLTKVNLPKHLLKIGDRAFANCSLSSIDFPDSVTSIGNQALLNNKLITQIRWPASIQNLGWHIIKGCDLVTSIEVPPNAFKRKTFLPWYSFLQTLETYTIPDGITRIEWTAFQFCTKLRQITIPDSVLEVGELAFSECFSLRELVFPKTLKTLHRRAIIDCPKLETIKLPREVFLKYHLVDSLSPYANSVAVKKQWREGSKSVFAGCTSLKKILLYRDQDLIDAARQEKEEKKNLGIWEDASFVYQNQSGGTVLIECKKERPNKLVIPNFISRIARGAFLSCERISDLYFEEGITFIDTSVFVNIPINRVHIPCSLTHMNGHDFSCFLYHHPFNGQDFFPYIDIPQNHPTLCVDNWFYYEKTPNGPRSLYHLPFYKKTIRIPDYIVCIGSRTFIDMHCDVLDLPASLRKIEGGAFVNCKVGKLNIPEGCKTLDVNWGNSLRVSEVVLPASLTDIGSLSDQTFRNSVHSFTCTRDSAAHRWFQSNKIYANLHLKNPGKKSLPVLKEDVDEIFQIEGNEVLAYRDTSRKQLDLSVAFEDRTNLIWSEGLFENHRELAEVVLPDGMRMLPARFFSGCKKLKSVSFPESLESLGADVFSGCGSLLELDLPEHIRYISPDLLGKTSDDLDPYIYGVPGSAAEQFAKNSGLKFIDRSKRIPESELTRSFTWKKEQDHIIITDIQNPADISPLIIPDWINGFPVTSFSVSVTLGRRKLVIGKNLTTLDCVIDNLTDIEVSPYNPNFIVKDGLFYTHNGTRLRLILPAAYLKRTLTIRSGTDTIDPQIFRFCTKLRELHILSSVSQVDEWHTGLKSDWSDPLVIYGANKTALKIAQAVRCVYVDTSLPEEEQRLAVLYKMLPVTYNITSGGKTPYGYVCHGYSGPDKELYIPGKLGNIRTTAIVDWTTDTTPDIIHFPASLTVLLDYKPDMVRKAFVVDKDNPKYLSVNGQLYDHKKRLLHCPLECDGEPALPDIDIICDNAFVGQHRKTLTIEKPLIILGDLFRNGSLDRLIVRERIKRVVISKGTIDTVVIPETLIDTGCLFYNAKWLSILDKEDHEICRLRAAALKHAADLSPYLFRTLPWLVRQHDEAFDDLKGMDNKIHMALIRLTSPYLLDEYNEARFRSYLSRSIKRCVELLCEEDDYDLFRKLCKTGLIHKQNAKKLVEITTRLNKTEWTALLLQSALIPKKKPS